MTARPTTAAGIMFYQLLGTRVRLAVTPIPGDPPPELVVDVAGVDHLGLYGRLVGFEERHGGPCPMCFWPWWRITAAAKLELQGELELAPGPQGAP